MTETPDGRASDTPELFCRDFAAVLDARGMSVRDAAERSNWSKSAIGNARTGPRLPRVELVTAVLAAVGVPGHEVDGWARRHAALAAAPASAPAPAPAPTPAPAAAVPLVGTPATVSVEVTRPPSPPVDPPARVEPAGRGPLVVAVLVTALLAGVGGWLAAQLWALPAVSAGPVVVTVQNKVALGPMDLVEDSGPAYLSSRAIAFCGPRGCKEDGTDVVSGAMLPATCTVAGERMWNYNLDSPAARNPNRAESDLWYRVSWPDGRSGFLSEVYLEPGSRGGVGLPSCR